MTKPHYNSINDRGADEKDASVNYGHKELAAFFPNMREESAESYPKSKELTQPKAHFIDNTNIDIAIDVDDVNIDKSLPVVQYNIVSSRPAIVAALKTIGVYVPEKLEELAGLVERALAEQPPLPEVSKGLKPLYKDRNNVDESDSPIYPDLFGKNIVQWLRLVWGKEMDAGVLTRVNLREVDPYADRAVENWLRAKPLPAYVRLPTKREMNDADFERAAPLMSSLSRLESVARRRKQGLVPPGHS